MGDFEFALIGATGFLVALTIVVIIFTTDGSSYSLQGVYADDNYDPKIQIFGEIAKQLKKTNEKMTILPWEDDKTSKSESSTSGKSESSTPSKSVESGKSIKFGKSGKLTKSDKSNKPLKYDESGKPIGTGEYSKAGMTKIPAPHLNSEKLDTWVAKFKAAKVINGIRVPIDKATDLPPIITVGKDNPGERDSAIKEQTTVVLDVGFKERQRGSVVIDTFGMPTYEMPSSPDVIAILPSITTTVITMSGQTVASPPLDKIVPRQKIILPVEQSVLPRFGGLSQLDVEAAEGATQVGAGIEEWFVATSNNVIPSSLPTLSTSGTQNTLDLFIDISYPFAEKGTGFNWSNYDTLAEPAVLQLIVNKQDSSTQQTDSQGCPVVRVLSLDENHYPPKWTTTGISVLSIKPISLTQCMILVESEHLSKFAIGGIRPFFLGGLSGYISSPNYTPKVFTQTYNGARFDVNYIVDGSISGMKVDEEAKSVTFDLKAVNHGNMLISLPHDLIYAPTNQYMLLVDNNELNYEVQDSTSQYVILKAWLPDGATRLTVMGTNVIPEFSSIAAMIIVVSMIGVITIHKKFLSK